jgi:MFS family permease
VSGALPLPPDRLKRAFDLVIWDGFCSQGFIVIVGGVFLFDFALKLGASNVTIGLLAALPPLAQLLQLPSVLLVERFGHRRAICVWTSTPARAALLLVAAAPFLASGTSAVAIIVAAIALFAVLTAPSNCAWGSWMRDLIPPERVPTLFARRIALMTAFGAVVVWAAGWWVDHWQAANPLRPELAYPPLFVFAAVMGFIGMVVVAFIPEPPMTPPVLHERLATRLAAPLRDPNYRRLIAFLGIWGFAVNLVIPFFTVYMLTRLDYDPGRVAWLSVVSQIANFLSLRPWGRLIETHSAKSALRLAAPVFVATIPAFALVGYPAPHDLTLPLIALLHVLQGATLGGIALASLTLTLRLAPAERATGFIAFNTLVASLGAGLGPIVAGAFLDELTSWRVTLGALPFGRWEALFAIAFGVVLVALNRLGRIAEAGDTGAAEILRRLTVWPRREPR